MNSDEKALARIIFKNKVLSANGQAYEDLFCSIMSKADVDFIPIKPQGKIGDRKNDGYIKNAGKYYQVFAPESPRHSQAKAIEKAEKDFEGLKSYWQNTHPIKEFYFVFNDKDDGPFPKTETCLKNIKDKNKLKSADVFLVKHLEDVLFSLPDDVIKSIIGYIPNPANIESIDYSCLREVITYILEKHQLLSATPKLDVPDFEDKIEFNELGPQVRTLLTTASYQMGALDEYFKKNSGLVKQELRDILNQKYLEAKKKKLKKHKDETTKGDLIFFDILESLIPNRNRETENAAIILMTKYFEACDIFEDPEA